MDYKNRCRSDITDGDILNDILGESYTRNTDNRNSSTGRTNGTQRRCQRNDSCSCSNSCMNDNSCLSSFPLAMVYCPDQEWRELYNEDEALSAGTMFKELELPFYPACRSCK